MIEKAKNLCFTEERNFSPDGERAQIAPPGRFDPRVSTHFSLQIDLLRVGLPDEGSVERDALDVAPPQQPLPRRVHPAEVGHARRKGLEAEYAAAFEELKA